MTKSTTQRPSTPEAGVYQRYAAAAQKLEPALCCPVEYAADFLSIIPQEVIERDYGCGDPTPYINTGETVLDLGSGGGKLCFIASQVVGATGRIIGIDCNLEMLALARKHLPTVAERVGYANVDFRYGLIQDLGLNLDRLETELASSPIHDATGYLALRNIEERLRLDHPFFENDSVDCVISNCVLNLVRQSDRRQLFSEIFRVLKRGGRAAISDIVSDETVPEHLTKDPTLWSGCLSGAFREDQFLRAFEDAGFHGIRIAKRAKQPWQTIEGIEFRSITIVAYKGKQGACKERRQAVIYRGPFKKVVDDDGHSFSRGERTAVCDKTFHLLQREPYLELFEPVAPIVAVPLETATDFDCNRGQIRHPRESKGEVYHATTDSIWSCGTADGKCC